jgi:serine/threonine protein kinase
MVLECTDIKLADFGSSEEIDHRYVGTLAYNSPELLLGYSLRYSDDIWAFGCTAITLLSGLVPFHVSGRQSEDEKYPIRLRRIEVFLGQKLSRELKERADLETRTYVLNSPLLQETMENANEFNFEVYSSKLRTR